ncbi:MAG: YaaR family protein [Desulfuromonadales bacterium]|nr:YaaR family protein [Desulfuromonadales bacterium]
MRIKDLLTTHTVDNKSSKTTSKNFESGSSFAVSLNNKQSDMDCYAQGITVLRSDIETAGDNLEKDPNLENFKKFRELLSQMAKLISTEAYRLEKIGGTPQNPRYFEIIRIINSEADHLYKLVLNEQRNRMAIVEKVIGIKGLVVNLIT